MQYPIVIINSYGDMRVLFGSGTTHRVLALRGGCSIPAQDAKVDMRINFPILFMALLTR